MSKPAPAKRTVKAVGSSMSEAFVPGWDKEAGHGQHRSPRIDARQAMGKKKTPLSATKVKG